MTGIILLVFSMWYWLQDLTGLSIHKLKEWALPRCVPSSTFPPPLNSFAHSRNTAVLWPYRRPLPDSLPFVLFVMEQGSSDSVVEKKYIQPVATSQIASLSPEKKKKKECELNGILLCTRLRSHLKWYFLVRMSLKGYCIHTVIKWWEVHTWICPTYWGNCTWSAFWLRMRESQESTRGKLKA